MLDHIIGNDIAKTYLQRLVDRGLVGNSLLFAGPEGVGKSLFAEALAKLVICQKDPQGGHLRKIELGNHPDIRIYRPEGKIGMHSMASMRQLGEEVYLAPYEASHKVFIIHEAERMLSYSANALLKTFEEPALDTIIILLSSAPAALLPTILSRCRTLHFQLLTEAEISSFLIERHHLDPIEATRLAMRAQGSIGHAVRLMHQAQQGEDVLRAKVIALLSQTTPVTYQQLSETASALAEQIEAGKKGIEEEVRASLLKGSSEHLSAVHKQSIEKEVEGAVAMHMTQEALQLFQVILGWYRDLHMLSLKGDANYAIHRDCLPLYQQCQTQALLIPLEKVQEAVLQAKISLERSTSLSICFENLFLKLRMPV